LTLHQEFLMAWLLLGLLLFLGVHSLAIVSPTGRDRLASRLGEGPYKGLYALLSLLGLVLIAWGYGLTRRARPRCCSTACPAVSVTWRPC
jgi:uncharacterized membrane protein